MIEKMKKLSLLIYHASRDRFLDELQGLGVVQLESAVAAENPAVMELKDELARSGRAISILNSWCAENGLKPRKDAAASANPAELLDMVGREKEKLDKLTEKTAAIRRQIAAFTPWGDYDVSMTAKLAAQGIELKLFAMRSQKFEKLDQTGLVLQVISEQKGMVYFAVLARAGDVVELEDATPEILPDRTVKQLKDDLAAVYRDIDGSRQILNTLAVQGDALKSHAALLSDRMGIEIARIGLEPGADGSVLTVTGWVPVREEKKLLEFLGRSDAAYVLENPAATDNVPVKLKNNAWARLYEPLTQMHSLPTYTEVDPTPLFAPFFTLFFGMCMADVGYGSILTLITLTALIVVKNKAMKPFIFLGVLLSLSTILGGFLFNSFFGTSVLDTGFPEQLKKLVIFGDMNAAMGFAIMMGVIQVLVGFCVQIVNKVRANGFFGLFQPLGTMMLLVAGIMFYILAGIEGDMSIGPIPVKAMILMIPQVYTVTAVLAAVGTLMILLFNNLGLSIFIRPLAGLWELYGIVTGVPGDILSYLRLFALGLAGGLLGNAFNQIAFMIRGDNPTIVNLFFMVFIMVLGHGLNLALALLGAFVHPLRLTLLEFFKASGFTGGARPYTPLTKQAR